jgi:hypothetical protein
MEERWKRTWIVTILKQICDRCKSTSDNEGHFLTLYSRFLTYFYSRVADG